MKEEGRGAEDEGREERGGEAVIKKENLMPQNKLKSPIG